MEEDNNNKILEKIFELYDEKHFNYNTFKKIREIIKNNSPQDERFTKRSDKCIPKQEGNTLGSVDIYNKALSKKKLKCTCGLPDCGECYYSEKDVKEAGDKLEELIQSMKKRYHCTTKEYHAFVYVLIQIKEIFGEL